VRRYNQIIICLFLLLVVQTGAYAGEATDTLSIEPADSVAWMPNPTGAAVRSLILPGWGQAYVHQPIKAAIYGGLEFGFILSTYRQHRLYKEALDDHRDDNANAYKENRNRISWYIAGVVILSMMDAYVDAHLFDFDVSPEFTLPVGSEKNKVPGAGVRLTFSWRLN